jgi:hypothetical protein
MSADQITFLNERIAANNVESFEVYVEACFTDEYHMTCILLHKQKLLTLELSVLQATLNSLLENGSG